MEVNGKESDGMDFVLKDGYIYLVKNQVLPNNKIEGNVIVNQVKNFTNKTFSYSINEKPYRPVVNNFLIIEREDLQKPYLELVIKASGDGGTELFKSDRIALTHAVIVGESVENSYPHIINTLNKKVAQLEQRVIDLEQVGDLI